MRKNKLYTIGKTPWGNLGVHSFPDGGLFGNLGEQLTKGFQSGALNGIGSVVGGLAGGAISDGYHSAAGDVFNAASKVAGMIPGPWGAVASAGAGILSGISNRLFGSKVDEAALQAANEGTNYLRNFNSNASTFDAVSGPQSFANVGDVYSGGIFTSGSASRKNRELRRQREEALAFANSSVDNNINNLATDQMSNLLANYAAFGGELGTNGTDWTNGLLYIDEGGSHEDNPLGGIPMGIDTEGVPNLVEEGETVYNDYVFSDRLKVPASMYKDLGLGGIASKMLKHGGRVRHKGISFADASKKLSKESEQRPNDPISQAGLEASLAKLAQVQEAERMRNQLRELSTHPDAQNEEFADGGKIGKKFAGEGDEPNLLDRLYVSSGGRYGGNPDVYLDAPWLPVSSTAAVAPVTRDPYGPQTYVPTGTSESDFLETLRETNTGDASGLGKAVVNGKEVKRRNSDADYYPTWMRYAPAFGAGALALTDALGLTNRPDYTYADKLEAAAERAGYTPDVSYDPIGDYLTYVPMDIWAGQNRLDSSSRAAARNILNTSGGNRGAAIAGLLANAYNANLGSGQLYRQALEYNDARRERVADFNRRTNMFNSQMGLEAAMANARYQQQARQYQLSGLAQAAAMRDAIDQRVSASRAANITNLLNNLGNIGRENFVFNQINSDKSRRYRVNRRGVSGYDDESV